MWCGQIQDPVTGSNRVKLTRDRQTIFLAQHSITVLEVGRELDAVLLGESGVVGVEVKTELFHDHLLNRIDNILTT